MKNDIATRADIELLVNSFYEKAKTDPVIGFFFTDVVKVNWEKHLPVMYSFWENIVFYTGGYNGNPMERHQHVHEKSPLTAAHFNRWLELFRETTDQLFAGEKAELIKQRAGSIATVMQIRFAA